jgi:hypothetical protein
MRGVPQSGVWSEEEIAPQSGVRSRERNRSERSQDRERSEGEAPREPGAPSTSLVPPGYRRDLTACSMRSIPFSMFFIDVAYDSRWQASAPNATPGTDATL